MPFYLLRFTAESNLVNETDVTLSYEDVEARFLFSKRKPDDRYLKVEVEIEAANNRDAQARASSTLLPQMFDALSFATGTPLLLVECELILKDETGSGFRRAIYVGHKKTPINVRLRSEAISEATKILQTEAVKLSTCWHRYALHRRLALDQFVFNWLAFEALAGDDDIASRCPRCGEDLNHCGRSVTHRGSSRTRAAEIFRTANPETTVRDFTNKIWNTARNKVFHGRTYPEPTYLTELFAVSTSLRKASEKEIARLAGVTANEPRPRYEDVSRVLYFVQWNTTNSTQRFATDWPEPELAELTRHFSGAPPKTFDYLDYKQSPSW